MPGIDKESKKKFFLKKTKNYRFTIARIPAMATKLENKIQLYYFYRERGFSFSINTSYGTRATLHIR